MQSCAPYPTSFFFFILVFAVCQEDLRNDRRSHRARCRRHLSYKGKNMLREFLLYAVFYFFFGGGVHKKKHFRLQIVFVYTLVCELKPEVRTLFVSGRGLGFRVKLILFVSLGFCELLRWPLIVQKRWLCLLLSVTHKLHTRRKFP